MRIIQILAVLAVAGLANIAAWYLPNRPVPLDPLPGGKLPSVSFAPFRDGQSPLTRVYPSREQIDEDLRVLSPQVAGVRTYTSLEGMEAVPELARKYGLKVTMGAWLSSKVDNNEAEVNSLIRLANLYPDTITRVIVGNEVLLRGELKPEQITNYIRKVKASVKQPVSYADVWEWWLKYPQMAKEVDYITIHLLPYWEDIPAGVERAAEHIDWSYHEIANRFPGKPILIGETGWPTSGRARGAAPAGVVAEARFISSILRLSRQEGFDVNVVEAFDQRWKQKLEGTMGGHWGLYTVDRQPKFPLSGPVVENPDWPAWAAASTLLGLALAGVLALRGPAPGIGGVAVLAFLSVGFASAWLRAADVALTWTYYAHDRFLALVMLILCATVAGAVLTAARRVLAGGTLAAEPVRAMKREFGVTTLEQAGNTAAAALAFLGVLWSFLIVFDGRYRNFPIPYEIIPAVGLLALGAVRAARRPAGSGQWAALAAGNLFRPAVALPGAVRPRPKLEIWLGRFLLAGAALTVIAEGVLPIDAPLRGYIMGTSATPLSAIDWTHPNWEALLWAAVQVLLALPFLASARLTAATAAVTAAVPEPAGVPAD